MRIGKIDLAALAVGAIIGALAASVDWSKMRVADPNLATIERIGGTHPDERFSFADKAHQPKDAVACAPNYPTR